jgi:hypothetical protein
MFLVSVEAAVEIKVQAQVGVEAQQFKVGLYLLT